ncbi:MAG TPA: hypothetical protein VFE96_04855 [Candidatus Bathyarchaeia archaeon]|jgi:hypothetical protein|nr:hypothetical protein [Candidatus Bathyarchaeia archaeon]
MIDKPHFEVKLLSDMLKVDLKEGTRAELDKLVGNRSSLRDTLGWVFQTIVPLDVHLWQIEKVTMEPTGKVNIKIPHRRDLHIPLEPLEAERLVEKMNELIPIEKERRVERELAERAAEAQQERERTESLKYHPLR